MVGGQGKSDIWNTGDGKVWKKITDSSPWKDRYNYGVAVFDNFIWVFGGREINPRNAYNDVWFSPNGTDWIQQTAEAPWTHRSGGFSIALHDKLFLDGGSTPAMKMDFPGTSGLWNGLIPTSDVTIQSRDGLTCSSPAQL